jgi:hypothetical protein
MSASLRAIAGFMDPVRPAGSIQELAKMHRWPTGTPPRPLSLRSLTTRHHHPQKVTIKFLWYNTFLLPGFDIPAGTFVGAVVGFVGGAILGRIFDGLGITTITIGEKPALELRALEIGTALRQDGYDLAALCEAFNTRERELILEAWPAAEKPFVAEGPDNSGKAIVASSGLFTIGSESRISHLYQRHTFTERGNRYRDADAWANKGVLLTEVDLGFGQARLEVYSTHLFAGGGIPNLPDVDELGLDQELSEEERLRIKLAQVDELVEVVRRYHRPNNVALIVGDFNTDADNPDAYGSLIDKMHSLDMEDIWAMRNGTVGYTSSDPSELGPSRFSVLDADGRYCNDFDTPQDSAGGRVGGRIDYVFVERQKPEHGFLLDVTRPRRRLFPRLQGAPDFDKIQFMSDHVGLEVTLMATPQ